MAQKFVHKVSPELTDDAQYTAVSEIPTVDLTAGSTVLLYPGTYGMIAGAFADIAFIGVGNRDDVVVDGGGIRLDNTATNAITVENMTLKGNSSVVTGGGAAVYKEGIAAATIKLTNVVLANAEFGVVNEATTGTMTLNGVDATGVDKSIMSNAAVEVNFSQLNTVANAYFTSGGAGVPAVTVRASTAGAANVGNTTETIIALIS